MSELSQQVADLPVQPGVYLMKNAAGKIIYIGKAKQLKKRVSSYFSASVSHPKTQSLVAQIAAIETIITASENEALVLEANLIKQHRPRYNVLMRDDKSYPYLRLSVAHDFPRLDIHCRSVLGRVIWSLPQCDRGSGNAELNPKIISYSSV